MKGRTGVAALGIGVLLAAGPLAQPVGAGKPRVKATRDQTWSPDFKHISPGKRLVWKNPTGKDHTVTAYGGNWSKNTTLTPGSKTRKKFKREGTYRYRCTIHSTLSGDNCSGMCGLIHVAR